MSTLRILQALLLLGALVGFWYANRWRYEVDFTGRVVAVATCSVLALIGTQGMPLAWLSVWGVEASARITGLDCAPGQKHHVRFEFIARGRVVTGIEPDYFGSETCDSLFIGKQGSVIYVADTPEIHAWGSLSRHLREYLVVLAFFAIAAPLVVYASVSKLRPKAFSTGTQT